ncbi:MULTISPECIES: manganese efflux pump [unclassified Lysinibacillus]|uniref:manganese efflux pump MntP n=1 Tax=unclassified Lysinibacillus TaxID=2636778 RepID=UPI00201279CD|nr:MULTISPECIES: manganese efflux pump [unclassified Lysinibacillus]MCL1697505.1 manganese efflux pump MntP family protein [Lysinibacillus sp. BPa_S21]MCL1699844.1 manganese efflux pump MntP family protein [Lysinibacillus sp. Bpr_S20]
MQGILAGILTSVDVIGLYVLIPNVRYRFFLSVWTAALHMLFPLLGFEFGHFLMRFLLEWGQWISSILLFCMGLHLLLFSQKDEKATISPILLAVTASLDTFSVSVSFGMLNIEKTVFIVSAGVSALICSYGSLVIARKSQVLLGNKSQMIAGIFFIIMGFLAIRQ